MVASGEGFIREGYFLNRHTWAVEMVSRDGGYPPLGWDATNIRLPAPLLYIAGPLAGMVYAIFFPPFMCVTSFYMAFRWAGRKLKAVAG